MQQRIHFNMVVKRMHRLEAFSKVLLIFSIKISGVAMKSSRLYIKALFFLCLGQQVFSQSTDSITNVTISTARKSYEFVKGDETHPVLIKTELATTFKCNGYRTYVPFVEMYDDHTSIDNVSVNVNGRTSKSIKPLYSYLPIDDVFYSDARICYFSLPLEKKNSQSQVIIKKTINDPRYFASVYFDEDYYIENEEISIKVPNWMKVEIREYNFPGKGVIKKTKQQDDAVIYTYTLQNQSVKKSFEHAPGTSYIYPHLLILSHSAQPAGMAAVTYFQTLQDQYNWYHSLIRQMQNDVSPFRTTVQQLAQDKEADIEKIKAVFQWVQSNIRYIAFEDGIAAYKPENAQEVYRKKYGDCKGMANLTKQMLKILNYDARLCWLGTNHIAYTYSTPSIAVDNHMICAVKLNSKYLFLDATEKYIGAGEYGERIQGRPVLIEDGNNYILETIPTTSFSQNTIMRKSLLKIDSLNIKGTILLSAKGESKEYLHFGVNSIASDKRQITLQQYLSGNSPNCIIQDINITGLQDWNKDISIHYRVEYKNAVSEFDNDKYINIDHRNTLAAFEVDSLRDEDLWLPYKFHSIDTTELILPVGYAAKQLPESVSIKNDTYRIDVQYKLSADKIMFTREIAMASAVIKKEQFKLWNEDIKTLDRFYREQIVLEKVNRML